MEQLGALCCVFSSRPIDDLNIFKILSSPLMANHVFSDGSVGTSSLLGQFLSCSPDRISRRHKQSSCVQEISPWLRHLISSLGQLGHAARQSYFKLFSHESARDKSCNVLSRTPHTRLATSFISSAASASVHDSPSAAFFDCFKTIFTNLVLQTRIN